MLNRILRIGTTFDWISPVVAFAQDLIYGPSHAFLIPEGAGWSGFQIKRLLNRHGIKVWGLMIVNRMIMLNVRQAQAGWAQYVLQRAGVPIQQGTITAPQSRSGARQKRNGEWPDPLTTFEQWLDGALDEFGF